MAEGIVYLDVDDEITSAASRIRSAPGTKVAIVVPYGSRIATSRMNFRLLSREAIVNNRRLSVVSGEAAARALAASAGLPVFATVAEYEAALAGPQPATEEVDQAVVAAAPIVEPDRPPRRRKGSGSAEPVASAVAGATAAAIVSDETLAMPGPAPSQAPIPTGPRAEPGPGRPRVVAGRRIGARTPILAAIAVLGLAAVIVGVGGYLLLPTATIQLTPRTDPIGPISLTIAADPTATAVDAANGIVPAVLLKIPVEASQTFTTAGRHVVLTAASGSVTFTNYDPTSTNTIPSGSVVSTEGGIAFRTVATVTVPRASFTPPTTTVPSHASVAVQAQKAGVAGNVPANAIRVVPRGENPQFLAVTNRDPTTGGVRTETPEVSKADVDKAVAALKTVITKSFDDAIAGGAGAPAGSTLFPDTGKLGPAVPDSDPASLIGRAVPTFDLRMTANGTVIAVDPSPIQSIAEAALRDAVAADHRLVDGSIQVDVGEGAVGEDGQVSFRATARATEVGIIDAGAIPALVKGRTAADAEAALAPLGDASVVLWPSWVTTVTTVDSRLSISIAGQDGSAGGSPPPSGATSGSAAP